MRAGWRRLPFDDVIADESGGNVKTPQSEFLSQGPFPVVDQGKDLVAGYMDDELRLCHAELPVIVFGDHTRCLKYVDFPFCMGADGVKVLRPRIDDADVKYLYHFLRTLRLTNGGYERHYKFLKRAEVVLPPLVEQRRIAEVLDRAETLRTKRRGALTQLDSLTQAVFLDLFGDPESHGWPLATISEMALPNAGAIRTGPFGSQLLHSEFVDQGVAVLGIDNAVANEFRWGDRRFITEAKYRELKRYTVKPGDVLITIMGTCGRCAVVPEDVPLAINTKHLCCITLDPKKCVASFLHAYFLRHPLARRHLGQAAKGAIMSGLNMGIIKSIPIPVAPIELQHEFSQTAAAVEKLRSHHRRSLAELDALFASLQHRAFRGEL